MPEGRVCIFRGQFRGTVPQACCVPISRMLARVRTHRNHVEGMVRGGGFNFPPPQLLPTVAIGKTSAY